MLSTDFDKYMLKIIKRIYMSPYISCAFSQLAGWSYILS